MLERIREGSQGPVAKIILGAVILTFALAGVGSYTNSVDTSVAQVNGVKITQSSFEQAYQSQRARMEQQFGEMFSTLAADATYMANFREGVLEQLINDQLIEQNALDMAMRVSDEVIKETIREMDEFKTDGVFDNNRYLAVINQAGFFQSSDFRDYLRIEMVRRQLSQALVATEFSLPYQHELVVALQNQTRDLNYGQVNKEQFKASIEISDEQVTNYYQENISRFETQEQVKVDYVMLDLEQVKTGIAVSDEELKAFYEESLNRYMQTERRRAAHILVEFGDDEDLAQEKINAALERLNKGEDFAAVAADASDDTISAENGGDLDWFERGIMDEAFDEATFALPEVGAVSQVVKSSFGFHIIKLLGVEAEKVKAFDEVRDELLARLTTSKAEDKFYELQQELATLAFESPDSLDDAAAAVNATIESSAWLSRFGNPAPFNNEAMVEALFSPAVIEENVNSDLVEISDSQVAVVHIKEHKAATTKPVEEVKAEIVSQLTEKAASEEAYNAALALTEKLIAGEDVSTNDYGFELTEALAVARTSAEIAREIVQQAYTLAHPQEQQSSVSAVRLPSGDAAVVQVTKVTAGEVSDVPATIAEQQTRSLAQSAFASYIESLKGNADISRNLAAANQGQL
jgi:peptidyl-prolyl cis-trans isomerase D